MDALAFPARISVEVTNRCNQTCTLCPRGGFTRPLGLIDVGLFERIADEVAGHDTPLWLHFLGEPLLHPKLPQLIAYAKAAGVRSVGLSTNATLLDAKAREALITSGLDRLDCSLDANDAETYRQMRGTDDFERATANIRALLHDRRAMGATTPTISLQFMDLPELAATIAAGVEEWRPLLGPDDFVKTIVPAPFHGAVDRGEGPDGTPRTPCLWLFGSLMILQDGRVTMCGADWDGQAPVGDLGTQTIAEVWDGPVLRARRQAHLESRFGDVPLCGDCTDWHLADGHGYANAVTGRSGRRLSARVELRPR